LSLVPQQANFVKLRSKYPKAADIVPSFVVNCYMPVPADGLSLKGRMASGLVVDAKQGFVLVSKAIVPHYLCGVDLIIAESININARVIFVHPLQNFSIVQFDTTLVNAPIKSPAFSSASNREGDETIFF